MKKNTDYKNKRTFIINKYYQVKTGFGVAGLFALCISMLLVITGGVLVWNNHSLSKAMTHQMDVQKVQDELLQSIAMLSKYGTRKHLIFEAYKAIADLKKNTEAVKESNELLKKTITVNTYLMWINGILGIALVAVVFFIIVRRAHRVAGPMYVLKRYMNEIADGTVPEIRPLRKGDEFGDVFDAFREMIASLNLKRRKHFKQRRDQNG